MNRLMAGIFGFVITLGILFSVATPVLAAEKDAFGGIDCKAAKSSALCTSKSTSSANPLTGPKGLIYKATLIIAVLAGIAAVIIMLVGSFMYITSGGDTGKVSEAKKAILYAVIGLVVIVVAQSLILYIINLLN